MSHEHKSVSDLKDKQITLDPGSLWAKLPVIGLGLAAVGFALGFLLPAPGGSAYANDEALWHAKVWTAYLNALMFTLALGFGGLIFTIIQHVVRANWSIVVRRLAENAMFTLPFVALAATPLLFGPGHHVFEWMHTHVVAEDPMLRAKVAYLNPSSFRVRFAVYMLVWSSFTLLLWKWSRDQDKAKTADEAGKLAVKQRYLAPVALLGFALTLSFGAFDFLMSLDPHWFSTMFGVYYFAGIALSFHALLVILVVLLQRKGMLKGVVTTEHFHDLGKFMFGFTVFWTYIGFSQYFLIWYANIPEETHWFGYRATGQWLGLSVLLIFGRFVLPFFFLLRRSWKRNPKYLVWVAVWIVVMELVDIFWLIQPTFAHHATAKAEAAGNTELAEFMHHHISITGPDIACSAGRSRPASWCPSRTRGSRSRSTTRTSELRRTALMADHGHHDPGGHELEAINTKLLFRLLISLSLVTLLASIAVVQWFNSQQRTLRDRSAAEGSFQLKDYKAEMAENLEGVDAVASQLAAKPELLRAPEPYPGWVHPDDLAGAAPAPAEGEAAGEDAAPAEGGEPTPAEGAEPTPAAGGEPSEEAAADDSASDAAAGDAPTPEPAPAADAPSPAADAPEPSAPSAGAEPAPGQDGAGESE